RVICGSAWCQWTSKCDVNCHFPTATGDGFSQRVLARVHYHSMEHIVIFERNRPHDTPLNESLTTPLRRRSNNLIGRWFSLRGISTQPHTLRRYRFLPARRARQISRLDGLHDTSFGVRHSCSDREVVRHEYRWVSRN